MQHALKGIMRAGERTESKKRHERVDHSLGRQGNTVRVGDAIYPWRPPRDRDEKEEKNRVLIRSIRNLLNSSTPERKDALITVFLEYRVHESTVLDEVVSIIFDAAVDTPAFCPIYAAMCAAQVGSELKRQGHDTSTGSRFKSEILKKVQETFNTKTISGQVEDKLRRTRMGHIDFIGHLYLERMITMRFMHYRALDLLKSIDEGSMDEDLIECAVRLLEKIGWKMEAEEEKVEGCRIQTIFDLLEKAKETVSNRVRLLIVNLVENRRDNWRDQRDMAVFRPRNIEDSREGRGRREEDDKENTQMAERRQHPGRGGRGRGGGGRGGWDGERRGNTRQEDVPRPVRPMQILMRRDQSPGRTATAPTVDVLSDTTSSTSTTTISSMRNQRGTLDSTGVLAMLTGGGTAPAPPIKSAPSAAATILQQSRPDTRRVEQKRHDKASSRDVPPKAFNAPSNKEVSYLGGKKVMRDACRIVTESGELSEYLVNNMMNEFLSETNRDFRVIAAVGPQTTGKSTILSMIAGNQPLDLFRQYVFRPSSREAVEQSKHQSSKVSIYVSKARNIFIDCQPMSCVSILDEQLQQGGRERGATRGGERLALQAHIENLQILAWTLQVSHSVLVCHDWFIDLDIVKQLRTAELLRGATDEISTQVQLPKLAPTRKTNLLFVHTRARPDDFRPANRLDRVALLKRLFGGAMRIRLAEIPASQANWNGEYALARPPLESIYFPLGEMKLREMSTQWQDERTAAGGHNRNTGPMSPIPRTPQQRAREKEKENNRVKEFIADLSGAIPFDEGIVDLRRVVHLLPRESFTPQGNTLLTEIQWFRFACGSWRDQTFRASVSLLESTIAARRKPRVKRETAATDGTLDRMRTMKISEKA